MDNLLSVLWLFFMCSLCAGVGTVQIMEDHCDISLGLFPPILGGQCPVGTMWMEQYKCCKKCIYCPPGERKAVEGCLSSCVPCEDGYFSDSNDLSATCQLCSDCDKAGLVQLMACHKDQDTICGDCPPGYYNHSKTTSSYNERSHYGTRDGCVKCQEHITAPECSVHFQQYYKEKAKNCTHSAWIVTTVILSICSFLGIGLIVVLAILYYYGKIKWKRNSMEEDTELEEHKKRLTQENTEPRREQGDGSYAEDASLFHQKSNPFGKEVPCISTQDFSRNPASEIDCESTSVSNPHLLGTPSHASTRSMSMPSLNHITVTVQVPVTVIPELTNAFPNIVRTLAASGVANMDQFRTFVQE